MKPSHRVLVNTIAQNVRTIINIVFSLYTIRVILEALGHEDYGIYNLIAGVVAMLAFITNALITTTQRFLSYNQGKNDISEIKRIFVTSLIIHIIISLILVVVLLLFTNLLFDTVLDIPSEKIKSAVFLYYTTIIMLCFSFISAPFRALLISHENIIYVSFVDLVDVTLKVFVALILTFVQSRKLELYGLLLTLVTFFDFVSFTVYSFFKYPECVFPQFRYFRKQYVKSMFAFAGWTIYSTGCIVGRHQGLAILINRYLGAIINAAYGISFQMQSCLVNFSNAIQNSINPQLMQAEGVGERRKMLSLAIISCKASFFIVSVIGIPCLFVMEPLLGFWLKNYPPSTVIFCRMTLIALIIDMTTTGLGQANQAVGNIGKFMVIVYSPKILSLVAIGLFFKFQFYLVWIAVVYILFEAVSAINRVIVSRSSCNLNVHNFVCNVLLRSSLSVILYSIIVYVLTKCIVFQNSFFVIIIVSAFFYMALFYLIGLDKNEKKQIINLFKSFKYERC